MKHLSIPEYGRIDRSAIDPRLLKRLQQFDENHASVAGDTVFDWSKLDFIRAINYVGVVQVPGIVVEILPKIDGDESTENHAAGGFRKLRARRNLLYMLSLTRDLPIQERDLASLRIERMPILEVLIAAFAARLLVELRRGVEHKYIYREEKESIVPPMRRVDYGNAHQDTAVFPHTASDSINQHKGCDFRSVLKLPTRTCLTFICSHSGKLRRNKYDMPRKSIRRRVITWIMI